MVARRHGDAELLDLAREGSAAALGSLLHRHRGALQRAVLRTADPERAAGVAMTAAVRAVRGGRLREPAELPALLEEATATSKYVYLDKPIVVLASQVVLENLVAVRLRAKAYVVDTRYEKAFETDITLRAMAAFADNGIQPPTCARISGEAG